MLHLILRASLRAGPSATLVTLLAIGTLIVGCAGPSLPTPEPTSSTVAPQSPVGTLPSSVTGPRPTPAPTSPEPTFAAVPSTQVSTPPTRPLPPTLAPGTTEAPGWTPPARPSMQPPGWEPPQGWNQEPYLKIFRALVGRMESYLATGRPAPEAIFTPRGFQQAVAIDELLRHVETDGWSVRRHAAVVTGGWQQGPGRYLPNGQLVMIPEAEVVINVEAGAETLDPGGTVVERKATSYRFVEAFTAVFDSAHHRWLIDGWSTSRYDWTLMAPQPPDPDAPACPWSGISDPMFTPFADRPWCDARGRLVTADRIGLRPGPAHCSRQSWTFLVLGSPIGWQIDPYDRHQYIREDQAVYPVASLPADAVGGITNGSLHIWTSASDPDAVFVTYGPNIERWPRGEDLCI